MGVTTDIGWTNATWNCWQGCSKVSEGCAHCYMYAGMRRYGRDPATVVRSKTLFDLPLKRTRSGEYKIPPGSKVFTCSWSDFFHKDADAWRDEAWDIIRQRPDLTFQILTKRPERIAHHLPSNWGDGWPNCWLLTTAETQLWADLRIPLLLDVPAVVHGVSCEPLLGPVELTPWLGLHRINWVICGGESQQGAQRARPMNPHWAFGLRTQCRHAGVPYFFKQAGSVLAREFRCSSPHGTDLAELPSGFRVREFPHPSPKPERLAV